MSIPEMFWFHCGRCGSLFQSQAGDSDGRLCAKCGAKPSLGLEPSQTAILPPATKSVSTTAGPQIIHLERIPKSRARKAKGKHLMLKIISGWVLVLAIIILGARRLWREDPAPRNHAETPSTSVTDTEQEDIMFINDAMPMCFTAFSGFLGSSTQEEQIQFILSSASITTDVLRFYNANPLIKVDPSGLSMIQSGILNLPTGKAIETLWNSKDGRKIDALFRLQNDEWKLDWHHFVRYSDHPWPLFLAGSGEEEGEFRLLARERLVEERKNNPQISLVLYAPRFGNPEEPGYQSPEFLIKRDSPDGKLLKAAFAMDKTGKQLYNSKLPNFNPDEMIRIRARIRRIESGGMRKFEIVRVITCHWYDIDDPGLKAAD